MSGSTPRFEILLFDLGGVLVDFAGFEGLARLHPHLGDPAALRDRWIASEAVRSFELGQIGADEFAGRFIAEWNLTIEPAAFVQAFADWFRGPYPGALSLLEELSGDYRLMCLSNSNEIHRAQNRGGIFDRFERAFVSHELGLLKPDRGIYAHVLRAVGVDAGRIAFFDDTEVNIREATAQGFDAHLVQGLAELEEKLRRLSVLS